MLRLLRSPRWVAGHILVLVTVVGFANLGLWQLDRLESRRAYNALLGERMAADPLPADALPTADPAAYRRVALTGTYEAEGEVLLSTRSQDGRPGHHVLTPLRTDGGLVVVDRGWVPLDLDDPPVAEATPPAGEVTVRGVLFPSFPARRSGALDGGEGRLQFVSDVDLEVLTGVLGPVAPLWVLADAQEPAQGGVLPLTAPPPPLTEGSHLSYAIQWFLFTGVVVVGYPLLLRRTLRDEQEAEAAGSPPAGVGPAADAAVPEPPVAAR
jgi:surfeit locus 1 family protein